MKHEIRLLKEAAMEIKALRSHNQLMSARLEMFDNMMSIFNAAPQMQGRGASPDIVYAIEKAIVEIENCANEESKHEHS